MIEYIDRIVYSRDRETEEPMQLVSGQGILPKNDRFVVQDAGNVLDVQGKLQIMSSFPCWKVCFSSQSQLRIEQAIGSILEEWDPSSLQGPDWFEHKLVLELKDLRSEAFTNLSNWLD